MNPALSLSIELKIQAEKLRLRKLSHDQLLAETERLITTGTINQQLLSQAMRQISELELREALASVNSKDNKKPSPMDEGYLLAGL
jgi:hypothetical protein